jgi:HlyD family secretion protein
MKTIPSTSPEDLAALIQPGDRASRKLRWIILIAVLAVAAIGFAIKGGRKGTGLGPQYVTVPIERGDLTVTITATGNIEPTNKVTVGSELSGTALEVLVDTNDQVTKGQPLAKLDTRKLSQQTASSRAALASAKAKVSQAQATLVQNEAALNRAKELQKVSGGKIPSKSDMDTAIAAADRAHADVQSAEAAVDEAKAQLEANETDLTKATISAPIDGTVLTRKLEPGQTVAASFTAPELFVIAENLERMKLKVAVAEADIGGVKEGQTASFTVDAWPERSYTAKVTKAAYGSTVTDNVVTYETELEVGNEARSLRPGMTATVDIRTGEAKGSLLVPSAALRFDPEKATAAAPMGPPKKSFLQSIVPGPPGRMGGRPRSSDDPPPRKSSSGTGRVWVLRDGKAEPIAVKTGLATSRMTEVSGEGLSEGLPVITRAASATP